MSPSTYEQRLTTFGYQKTGLGSTCPFRKQTAYLLLWEWRSKGAWQYKVVREYGKLKAAESQRSVSEFACATRLEPCEDHLSHCSSGKIRNIRHYTARRQVKVMCLAWEQEVQTDSNFLFLMKVARVLTGHPRHMFPLQTVELAWHTKNK